MSLLTLQSIVAGDSWTIEGLKKRFLQTHVAQASTGIEGRLEIRELFPHEFLRVENEVWSHYHDQKAHPGSDRIFGALIGGYLVGAARCSKHPDGYDVDGVFVLSEYRGRGIARKLMDLLIRECGEQETLYMHSRTELIDFYASFGFCLISERELPKTIRDRFIFHSGELETLEVTPMKREPGRARV
ncbi:GNAT family N-acetyltransferase [uncultured Methanofollis sp.]|uniref:GNAT family N-acetyltransferase n=1 Tax=uncultured Methanofollis sp. TaxID=262500 RepID=UPI00260BC58F|nr:GNAT family N-acetyltransferase [uncultured Methanofollis sp.]